MVKATVLWFGMLREQRQQDTEDIELKPGTTMRELYRSLCPPTALGELPVSFARNEEHCGPDTIVCDGDVLVFLPPVGGGR
jgi:molybdopterin converting factor small subunit